MVDKKAEQAGYLKDKWNNTGVRQFDALPESIQKTLVYGSLEERSQALSDIAVRERLQSTQLFGEAAKEFVEDLRSVQEINNRPKAPSLGKKIAGIFPGLRKK
jgi:curli biogenesis system outer membrane secretion channel CsgG